MASFGRAEVLKQALDQIEKLRPQRLKNLYLLVSKNDDETESLLRNYPSLSIKKQLVDAVCSPGATRNLLVEQASSPWLCFMDDDTVVSEKYFEVAEQIIDSENLDVFGGPDQALGKELTQLVLGEILSEFLVMGPTYKRHKKFAFPNKSASEIDLTLCNLWMNAEVFNHKKNRFNESLNRCEENLLLDQLSASEFKIAYFPQLYLYHRRRNRWQDMINIQLKSGYYRGLILTFSESYFKPFFLIPIVTGFLLFVLPFVSPKIFLKLVSIHLILSVFVSLKIGWKLKSVKGMILAFIYIIIIHCSFSMGCFIGWLKGVFNRK